MNCDRCGEELHKSEEWAKHCWECEKIDQIIESIKETFAEYILTPAQKSKIAQEIQK